MNGTTNPSVVRDPVTGWFTRNPGTGTRRRSGGSRCGVPDNDPRRRLPLDDELVRLWEAHGRSYALTAEAIGCSASAVGLRIRKLGLHQPRRVNRGPTWQLGQEIAELQIAVASLMTRVAELEPRPVVMQRREPQPGPVRLVEWRPDHRRQADGGKPVRAQRREVGLPKRPKAVA